MQHDGMQLVSTSEALNTVLLGIADAYSRAIMVRGRCWWRRRGVERLISSSCDVPGDVFDSELVWAKRGVVQCQFVMRQHVVRVLEKVGWRDVGGKRRNGKVE